LFLLENGFKNENVFQKHFLVYSSILENVFENENVFFKKKFLVGAFKNKKKHF
jgi:hypothetical protein